MSTQRQYDNGLHMMEELGGSFVKSLVNCYYCADSSNKAKLREAFAEYFERYDQMYKEHRRRIAHEQT